MGLFMGLLTLPLAPVRGVVWVAELLHDEAERRLYDPAAVRRQLAQVEEAQASGELSDDEAAELENELLGRMMTGRPRKPEG
jgi:hypothetical protein